MTTVRADLSDALLRRIDMRAIAAMGENGVIGKGNAIPWKIAEEMAFFRKTTENAAVLMGRKTFESIGAPLPNRQNIVITGDAHWTRNGVTAIGNFEQLLHMDIKTPLWVCGGAVVYADLLPACRELYLSIVAGEWDGDVKFPDFSDFFVKDKTIFACKAFRIEHYLSKIFPEKIACEC
jgi:dihydrofolate reductase